MLFEDMLGTIGRTPLVRINRLADKKGAAVYAKLEYFNPGGSVKDRIALSMIEDAEARGVLKPGGTIIEPTSGNTGIGLAMVAAVKGYKAVFTIPSTMSVERQKFLKAFGAEIVLVRPEEGPGMTGAIKKANELAEKNGWFRPRQFDNPANPDVHRETTGPEIIRDFESEGRNADAFVAGIGTGGTITGAGERLKQWNPEIQVVGVEPAGSPVLSGGKPGPHKIQGIGAGFRPKVLNMDIVDEIIRVSNEDAMETARQLAKKEGILAGISSGANLWAAVQVARRMGKGKNVIVVLPDTGERYLSGELFEG